MADELKLDYDKNFDKSSKIIIKNEPIIHRSAIRKLEYLSREGEVGMNYPSLNAKKYRGEKHNNLDLWEFRISKKYRCFFTFDEENKIITAVKIINHP